MNESIVWSPDSIMNIAEDTMSSSTGTVSTDSSSLILSGKSEAVYTYTFDTSENLLKASNLRLILNVANSDASLISRYEESVQVELVIQYYKELVGADGSASGYGVGNIDTYQINPYFNHESNGYIRNYDLDIDENPLVFIEVKFINTSDNTVTFMNPQLINSMTIMDAITTYGGGSGGGGGGGDTPAPELTILNDLVVYSMNDSYDIDVYNGGLDLKVAIPEKYLIGTSSNARIAVSWTFTTLSGNPVFVPTTTSDNVVYNGVTYYVSNNRCRIYNVYSNGTFKVRAEITDHTTGSVIYDEKTISIINCNIIDVSLSVDDPEEKIRGTEGTKLKFTINNNLGLLTGNVLKLSVESYDGGFVYLNKSNNPAHVYLNFVDNEAEYTVYGNISGKVKIILTPGGNVYPTTFRKEFIVDVVACIPNTIHLVPDKYEIRSHDEIVNVTVYTDTGSYLNSGSGTIIISYLNGGKLGANHSNTTVGTLNTVTGVNGAIKAQCWGLDKGKAILVAKVTLQGDNTTTYISDPVEIDITFADEEPAGCILESSTGVYEIDQGAGQLVLTPVPDYTWYRAFSFSKLSVDGGDCNIATGTVNGMQVCTLTATKNGTVRITATPTYGPIITQDIVISGQYPEDVVLSVDTNTTKMLKGTSLIVRAKPGNNPNTTNYKFRWDYQYLDTVVRANFGTKDNNTAYQVTGTALGKILVRCMDWNTYELLGTIELEVVETLD